MMPSISEQEPTSWAVFDHTQDPSDDTQTALLGIANLLWFYSLLISIYCATLTLLKLQAANPRTWVTSTRCCLIERARADVLLSAGILERSAKKSMTISLCIIFLSLLLFLSGLACFFFLVDIFKFEFSLSLISIFPNTLLVLKAMDFLRRRSPHCTPFTQEKIKIKEQGARLDGKVLKRTLDMSRSDDDLERFFEAIPGFCASKIVDNPRLSLDVLGLPRLAEALIEFWNRTLSSNRVSESVKVCRLVACVRVIEAADLSIAVPHILHLFSGDLGEASRSVETGHSLRSLCNGDSSLARGMIASVISNAERNDRWFVLAMDELGISRDVLRDYLARGDSVLLANLIHISRHFLHGLLQPHPDLTREALTILPSVSKFDILDTLPELQHDFCALWNDVVRQVQSSSTEDNPFKEILLDIWDLYVALHGTTTTKYDPLHPPLCEDKCHRNLTTHVQ